MMRVFNTLKSIISNIIIHQLTTYLLPICFCHRSGKPSRYDCLRLVNGMGSSFTSKELVNMVAVCRGSVTWAWNRWMKGCVELVIIYTWHVTFYIAIMHIYIYNIASLYTSKDACIDMFGSMGMAICVRVLAGFFSQTSPESSVVRWQGHWMKRWNRVVTDHKWPKSASHTSQVQRS